MTTDRPITAPADAERSRSADADATRPRWDLLFVGILLIGANLRAAITTVGPVLTPIRDDLGLSSSAASLLISIPVLSFGLFSLLAPVVARRFGLEWTMAGSLALSAIAILIRSSPIPAGIWIGTALLGTAIAMINVTLPSLVKRDYPTRLGPITGLYSILQGATAAIASGIVVPLSGLTALGWRLGIGIWAVLALIALLVFLPRLRHPAITTGIIDPLAHDASPSVSFWRSPLAWQVTAYMGLQSTAFFSSVTWLPSYEQDHGFSASAAGTHLFVMLVSGLIGTTIATRALPMLRDQRGLALISAALFTAGFLGFLLLPQFPEVWMILNGLGGGIAIVVALTLFGYRTTSYRYAARLSGMAQSIGYLVAAVVPFTIGLLHDATGSWTGPMLVLVVVGGLLGVFGVLSGRNRLLA